MRKTYYIVDIFKYIFCMGIVVLHMGVLDSFGLYSYWLEKCLIRLGVPFFFMISGFMLEEKLSRTDGTIEDMKAIFINWSKRLAIPLVFFGTISLVLTSFYYYLENESLLSILARVIRAIIFYPLGATWYLQACIVGVWIIYVFCKKEKEKWIFPCGIVLYIFALLCNSYYFVISDTSGGICVNYFIKITRSARNGVFYGFLFLALGMCTYKVSEKVKRENVRKVWLWALSGGSYFLYIVEIYLLRNVEMKDDGSLFLMLPLFIFMFVVTIVQYTTYNDITIKLRNLSTGIYLLHSPVRQFIQDLAYMFEWQYIVPLVFAVTVIVTHTVCLWAYRKDGWWGKLLK